MNSAMAFGGGIGAEVVSDLVAQQAPEFVQENPEITELIPAAAGIGLLYFAPGKTDPLAYGMIGASGAGMSDRIVGAMQGFNRYTMQGTEAAELSKGREFVEKLIDEGFTEESSDIDDVNDYGDGMS